jgi:hypothetical protein
MQSVVPKSTLSERVPLFLQISHDEAPIFSSRLDVLEQTNEDIFMDVGVPRHNLALRYDSQVCKIVDILKKTRDSEALLMH